MMIAAGLFASTYLGVGRGKAVVATLLTIGLTMIPAAGLLEVTVARTVVKGLLIGIGMVVVCQWIVYPFFPEDPVRAAPPKAPPADPRTAAWLALRTTLIVLPSVMLAFTNPSMYMPMIMKSVQLGTAELPVTARAAGHELLGSTFLAGAFAACSGSAEVLAQPVDVRPVDAAVRHVFRRRSSIASSPRVSRLRTGSASA